MGHLPCIMAQAYTTVERHRTKPARRAARPFIKDLPQTNMMSSVGAAAIRFLESELFFFPLIIEGTHRCGAVGPVKHHAADDLKTRAQGDRVGWKPASCVHGAEDVIPAADQSDIERIA